ncbi:uncharacterized protein PFL1_04911 [Pseudozyma flocculosa PF-1]|uniref:Mediator complex subunit 16 n=2 Tax=Pseudozyma flocculosa TaxID=84751 RepID=A0A5C3EVB2_9BASI|nr:uncharacterized protein PFL1_04911 [Pseudozyma flocculosa PF-1]EPQ27372.1 hypothetical protein PFL1_04911 [Pseudozyma flocculosa PF-1]SPO36213.1 uncharacterized protein PSFLO_01684 [Pseudozyma flocculosa]
MSSPKRRRIGSAAGRSEEQLEQTKRLLLASASHEADLTRSNRLLDLAAGRSDRQQLAWSRHNLIARASSTFSPVHSPNSPSAGGIDPITTAAPPRPRPHVVLRSLAYSSSAVDASALRPCHLYPPDDPAQPFPNPADPSLATTLPQPRPTEYGDPECIAFSPCGFYLAAYFPLSSVRSDAAEAKDHLLSRQEQALQQIEQATAGSLNAAPAIPSLSRNSTTGGLGDAPGMASALAAGLLPPVTSNTPPALASPSGKLCIWSRAETGALNGWRIMQVLEVLEDRSGERDPSASREGYLEADGQSQLTGSLNGSVPGAGVQLQERVKRILWLGGKRNWVLEEPAAGIDGGGGGHCYRREAGRGPSFLNAEESAGPQRDLALVVFGQRGGVTLLHSRDSDRQSRSSSAGDAPPFEVLQSSLFTPALRPAPPTISNDMTGATPTPGEGPLGANRGLSHVAAGAGTRASELSHLAVGLVADEPVLLVACKQNQTSESSVQLCEITIDLKGDAVSMVTRPLSRLPLISTWTSAEGDGLATESGLGGGAALTSLCWIQMEPGKADAGVAVADSDPQGTASSSLRLAATFDVASGDAAPAAAGQAPATIVKVWDLLKDDDELSEAFGQLECRKAGQPTKMVERSPRLALTRRFEGETFTSMLPPSSVTAPTSNVVTVTSLSSPPTAAAAGSNGQDATATVETIRYLDAVTLDPVLPATASSSEIPTKASDRDSTLALSPNALLAAALARDPAGASRKKLVIWRAPAVTSTSLKDDDGSAAHSEENEVTHAGRLLGLAMLRRSDPFDLARALFSGRKRDFYAAAILRAAESLGMVRYGGGDGSKGSIAGGRGGDEQTVKTEPGETASRAEQRRTMPTFLQTLRLLEVQLSLLSAPPPSTNKGTTKTTIGGEGEAVLQQRQKHGDGADAASGDAERLVLSLSMLHKLLRQSRVLTRLPSTGAATGDAEATRVHYRLASVWPLIAHLQWTLGVLDALGLLAFPTVRVTPLVELLTYRTPRLLLVAVLRGLCEFKAWLLSTVHADNLPPFAEADEQRAGSGGSADTGAGAGAGGKGLNVGVMAVSEQMELAREAIRHSCVQASMDLEACLRVLSSPDLFSDDSSSTHTRDNDNGEDEDEEKWWLHRFPCSIDDAASTTRVDDSTTAIATMPGGGDVGRAKKATRMLQRLVDAQQGGLVDPLTLFLRPSDLVDERSVLLPSPPGPRSLIDKHGAGTGQAQRDVITKSILPPASRQTRTKRCLRCGQVAAFHHHEAEMAAQGGGMKSWKWSCLCGGPWWIL